MHARFVVPPCLIGLGPLALGLTLGFRVEDHLVTSVQAEGFELQVSLARIHERAMAAPIRDGQSCPSVGLVRARDDVLCWSKRLGPGPRSHCTGMQWSHSGSYHRCRSSMLYRFGDDCTAWSRINFWCI
ncbi:hypothetical protein EDB80DRAFT_835780 [Ilyonectria destructans]|nr:hypothetical protein EDB80DRAFT_835780 [Ilyonectria destructans]